MHLRSQRGEVVTLVLLVVGILGATQLVPNWRVGNLFKKGPPIAQLQAEQAKLDKLKADAAKAEADLKAAIARAQAETKEQVGYSQQMVSGASLVLKKAPVSPEVTLAASFLDRASLGLKSAIGELPAARQAEIIAIVEGALSAKQAEVDAAKAQLAQRDHDLQVTIEEKKILAANIPILTAKLAAKDAEVAKTQAIVTAKTAEVITYAEKAVEKERENGSLQSLLVKIAWVVGILIAGFGFVNFVLPSLAAEFPKATKLQKVYRSVTSLTSAHDVTDDIVKESPPTPVTPTTP